MTKPDFPSSDDTRSSPRRGYIEGYYGRLLSWDDRHRIINHMASIGMTDYFYAPKDDPCHRFQWRRDYDQDWQDHFRQFTQDAKSLGISVSAGIAPGIDFDFSSLHHASPQHESHHETYQESHQAKTNDYAILVKKSRQLADLGATEIGLLLDDINPRFFDHGAVDDDGDFSHEGAAHTALANALLDALDVPLHLTPRIYADNIEDDGQYLNHMARHLNPAIKVFTCGTHIIAADTELTSTSLVKAGLRQDRLMIWDNLYAHDYCPRRLFLGAYLGRHHHQDLWLNPTGMVETDCFLLSQMAVALNNGDSSSWHQTCRDFGVPDAFFGIAHGFWLPPHDDLDKTPADHGIFPITPDQYETALTALDELLWRWKSPLQREWYPYLMGLRQDILLLSQQMSPWRIRKSLPPLLAAHFTEKN